MPVKQPLHGTLMLIVKHPVPSLNALFGMSHWQRVKEKKKIQIAFASALSACGIASSIQITFARNTMLTASDMQASYEMTRRTISFLKSASERLKAKPTNAPSSRSSPLIKDMTRALLIQAYWARCSSSWNRVAFDVFVQTLSDSDLRQYIQMGTT